MSNTALETRQARRGFLFYVAAVGLFTVTQHWYEIDARWARISWPPLLAVALLLGLKMPLTAGRGRRDSEGLLLRIGDQVIRILPLFFAAGLPILISSLRYADARRTIGVVTGVCFLSAQIASLIAVWYALPNDALGTD